MPAPSTILIKVIEPDDTEHDITPYVLFQETHFEFQGNATPGTFDIALRDTQRELVFGHAGNSWAGINVGAEVYLFVDDVKQFGGILMEIERHFAFDVVDTSDIGEVDTRMFTLRGVDFNIWFDKRVIRDTDNYKRGITIPGVHYDGDIIRNFLPDYIDVPPGVTFPEARIEDIEKFGIVWSVNEDSYRVTGTKLPTQGDPWRKAMENLAWRSAAVWYIDAAKRVNFKSLETAQWDYVFTDRPQSANHIGCRAVNAVQDGTPIVTEALVWGGLQELADGTGTEPSGSFFAKYPSGAIDDDDEQEAVNAKNRYGLWQYAEVNFQRGDDQVSVRNRAKAIIMGPPGVWRQQQSGMREPLWNLTLTWFAHNIPGASYLVPGQVVTIMLYVMGHQRGSDWIPLVQTLPLRTVQISFPEIPANNGGLYKGWVQYTGTFGISLSDNRQLWRFLLRQHYKNTAAKAGDYETYGFVTNASTTHGYNAPGEVTLDPDGTTTVFNITTAEGQIPYISGTAAVFINGLQQRKGTDFTESDATTGEITFVTAPLATDEVSVQFRAGY